MVFCPATGHKQDIFYTSFKAFGLASCTKQGQTRWPSNLNFLMTVWCTGEGLKTGQIQFCYSKFHIKWKPLKKSKYLYYERKTPIRLLLNILHAMTNSVMVYWRKRGGGGKSATQQMLSKYMQTQKDRLIKLAVHIAYIHLLILSQQREYMTTSMFMLCRSSSNLLTYYLILLPLLHPLHVWRQNAFHVFPTSWSAMKGS